MVALSAWSVPGVQTKRDEIERIVDVVCDYMETPRSVALGKSQEDEIVYVRHFIYYMVWLSGGKSLKKIGQHFEKHHCVIKWGRDRVMIQLKGRGGDKYKQDVQNLKNILEWE